MLSVVTVHTLNPENTESVAKILQRFDETVSPDIQRLRRRQAYTYCDLCIQIEDWHVPDAAGINDARLQQLNDELSPYLGEYRPEISTGGATATRFYDWPENEPAGIEGLHCTVIVNRMEEDAIPEVHRLFANLDATDFPRRMGTLRRQIYLFKGVYLHVQDFVRPEGAKVIGKAWQEADPRFLRIVADLQPLVPPYDKAAGQLAARFYHWAAND